MKSEMKILVFRTDHLGDVLLSLKSILLMRHAFPSAKIRFVVQRNVGELIYAFCLKHQVELEFTDQNKWQKESWDGFLALYCDFKTAFQAFKKKIPIRCGQKNHIWSFWIFNRGFRQKRTLRGLHESEYTIELSREIIKALNQTEMSSEAVVELPLEIEKQEEARETLRKIGMIKDRSFIVLHPGMSGSALNLSEKKYLELLRGLKEQFQVLVSVGPSQQDQRIWKTLSHEMPDLKKIPPLSLGVLKEVYRLSAGVIAPSTGPLHLAHCVGVPVIGLYSPVRAHHPRRWGPKGGRVAAQVLVPPVECPAQRECWKEKCQAYPCMEKTPWTDLILGALNDLKRTYAD